MSAPRVLIVDDNAMNIAIAQVALTAEDFDVETAADGLEALLGAVFLDGGFDAAQGVIRGQYAALLERLDPQTLGKDPKTLLQEMLQARKIPLPQYAVVGTQGAAHSQQFEVECQIPQLAIRTTGFGASRRIAEQEAAQRAFAQANK